MPFIPREESFVCEQCGLSVEPLGSGTYRNHCPECLFSKHVDRDGPGDRLSSCRALLEPISVDQDGKKGLMIHYRCVKCGKVSRNRAASDDKILKFMQNNN